MSQPNGRGLSSPELSSANPSQPVEPPPACPEASLGVNRSARRFRECSEVVRPGSGSGRRSTRGGAVVEPVDPVQGGRSRRGRGRARGRRGRSARSCTGRSGTRPGRCRRCRRPTDRGVDASGGEPFGERDRDVLGAGVGVVDQPGQVGDAVLRRVQIAISRASRTRSVRHRGGGPPAHDPPGEHVDHERDVDHAGPGRDVGEVRDPQPVRGRAR